MIQNITIVTDETLERMRVILRDVQGGVEKILPRIIDRARTTARATALKEITAVYDIKQKDIRDRKNTTINMYTQQSNNKIVGVVSYSGTKIPLYRFGVSHKTPKKLNKRVPVMFDNETVWVSPGAPVSARLRKDRPKTLFKNSFIAKMKSGHFGMFERMNPNSMERLKIREFPGASTAEMAEIDPRRFLKTLLLQR